MLKLYVVTNSKWYIPFLVNGTKESIMNEINSYIALKMYDLPVVDFITHMLSNILGIDILVVENIDDVYSVHTMTPIKPSVINRRSIVLLKCGAHYDACVRVCEYGVSTDIYSIIR